MYSVQNPEYKHLTCTKGHSIMYIRNKLMSTYCKSIKSFILTTLSYNKGEPGFSTRSCKLYAAVKSICNTGIYNTYF